MMDCSLVLVNGLEMCMIFISESIGKIMELFKELCRRCYGIYPEMIVYQINMYREVWDILRRFHQEEKTVIMVSHDEEIIKSCPKVVRLGESL